MKRGRKKREEEMLWLGKERGGSWQTPSRSNVIHLGQGKLIRDRHHHKYLTSAQVLVSKSWSNIYVLVS